MCKLIWSAERGLHGPEGGAVFDTMHPWRTKGQAAFEDRPVDFFGFYSGLIFPVRNSPSDRQCRASAVLPHAPRRSRSFAGAKRARGFAGSLVLTARQGSVAVSPSGQQI